MNTMPDWLQYAVKQKRDGTGCVAAGYEFLLRAARAEGISWDSFQDDFDLDQRGGEPKNNFVSVAKAVKERYANIELRSEGFDKGKGSEKLKRVEELFRENRPVLVSVAQTPHGGWHIMPVIGMKKDSLLLLHHVNESGECNIQELSKGDFVDRHDNWAGGDDIAYLGKC